MEFHLHSTVRSRETRTQRARAPIHIRRTQFVLKDQRRLIPGRCLVVSEMEFKDNLDSIRELEANGILKVCTPMGHRVDLATLESVQTVEPPLPIKVLDSAANDPPPGKVFRKTDLSVEASANPESPIEIMQPADLPQQLEPDFKMGKRGPIYPHPLFQNPGDRSAEVPTEHAAPFVGDSNTPIMTSSDIEGAFGGPADGQAAFEEEVPELSPTLEEGESVQEVIEQPKRRGRRK